MVSGTDETLVEPRPDPIGPAGDEPRPQDRRFPPTARTVAIAATAVGLLPFIAVLLQVLAADQLALNGDDALIELRVRDVGSADTPLLGSYQRFGFHMPGPVLLYLLAPFYRLAGSNFSGLQVGALCINAAAFVGVAATVLKRFGAVPTLWAVLLLSVLVQALGPARISDPWEPMVTVLPLVLFLVLTATLASGAAWAMPVAAGVATVLAQSQATLAPTVAVLLALGGVVFVWTHPRAHGSSGFSAMIGVVRRPALITVAVLGVLWLPPLVHELGDKASNIGRILLFSRGPEPVLGMGDAVSGIALQTDHRAGWITGEIPNQFASGLVELAGSPTIPFSLLALVAATVWAARRRDRSAYLGATVLAGFAVGVVVLSRLVGGLYNWILFWTWALGMTTWLAVGVCAWRSVSIDWRRRAERSAVAVLGVGVVAMVAVSIGAASSLPEPEDRLRSAVLDTVDETVAALDGVDGPVLIRSDLQMEQLFGDDDIGVEPMALALERAGYEVRVESHLGLKFGDHRTGDDAVAEVVLVTDGVDAPPVPGEIVATVDTRTQEETEELERLTAELRAAGLEGATVDDVPAGPDSDILRYDVGRSRQLETYRPLSVVVGRLEP